MSIRRITTLIVVIASLIIVVSIGSVSYLFIEFDQAQAREKKLRQTSQSLANVSSILSEYLFLATFRVKRQLRLATADFAGRVEELKDLPGESARTRLLVERRQVLINELNRLFSLEQNMNQNLDFRHNTELLKQEIGGQLILICREMSGYLSGLDAELRRQMAEKRMILVCSALAAILLISVIVVVIILWMRRHLLIPIFNLHQAAGRIAAGDYTASSGVARQDEIGDLAASFDTMKKAVQEHVTTIAASEENLRITLDSIGDAVIAADIDGRVTDMNPVAEQLTGWPLDKARNRPVTEVFRIVNSQTREQLSDPVEQVLVAGEKMVLDDHTALIRRDGVERQVADSGSPIRDAGGRVTGVVLVFRDVTEAYLIQEELRRNEKFLQDIFEAIQDGLSVLDRDLNIVRANGWMQRRYAGPGTPLEGRKCYTVYQQRESICPWCPSVKAMETGLRQNAEVPYPDMESPTGWIDLSVFPMKNQQGRVTGLIEYVKDITDKKQAENELLRARDELARRAAELERSNSELEDFAYIASHDLKEPLRGIHNYASFLLEDYEDKLDQAGRDKLLTLTRLASRLEMLLDDLLNYSRVGQSGMALRQVDSGELVRQVLETMGFLLDDDRITVTMAENMPRVICDRARVGEVFRNLISNAVKYNDQEAPEVAIGWEESRESGRVVLYVRDNGIGIPARHLDKIFKIFKRLHARDKYGGGTGSGLTLARKIIERHGGQIWAESEPGRGSIFRFTLPTGGRHD
ncbi:MAG: PAS domain-containing protein [Desulfosudaceae bacterium]